VSVADPATATPPPVIHRVGRRGGLLSYSTISPVDAALTKAGNRFDVVGGGVLYAASTRAACYAETLARFRPTPRIRALLGDEPGFMVTGGVPQDWRLQRTVGDLELRDPLPFLDVEDPATHEYLSDVLAQDLVSLSYAEPLDFSDVSNQDRRLSRTIALHAYTATESDGSPTYSGIRYASRISPDWECWAVFEGTWVEVVDQHPIELDDPALQEIADLWGLRLF
jgi:hypothetical protein